MIVFINGNINSGKTTLAKFIYSMNLNFAFIEVDDLREMIRYIPIDDCKYLNLKNAIDVAKNFDEANINSLITYPLNQIAYDYVCNLLDSSGIEFMTINIYPGIETLKQNRGERKLNDWEVNRIQVLHDTGFSTPNFGHAINTENLTVEQTADKVLKLIKQHSKSMH